MQSTTPAPRPATALKLAIVASGLKQKDIADAVGLDPARLSNIVNGLHCDDATRAAIAREVGRKVEDLWPSQVAA